LPLEDLVAGVPVAPSKLIAVGRNYRAHAEERGAAVPTSPLTWLKAPSSLLASGGFVELPYPQHKVDFEAELGIVIGRAAKNVTQQDAAAHIFGFTTCLDISDRDIQDSEKQFARAKSFDTFTPMGPYVYQGVDASDLPLILHQNGTLRQNGRTSQMIFPVAEIVSFCSQGTTLLPGDLILTGTPAGVGAIHAGDLLETRIGPFAPLIVHVRDAIA
jgi:2-keto-4-pentenoate hydratase/2-oxohepta-3-ene-1,7-dioic acid hydratase in catechol pathway